MKVISFKTKAKSIEIYPIADIHIGNRNTDYTKLKKIISSIASKENSYLLLLGDIMNFELKYSKGNVYFEELSPQEQLDTAVNLFSSVANRILACVAGNHDLRVAKEVGIDIVYTMCQLLQISDKYDETSVLLHIEMPNAEYDLYITHGYSFARKAGGKLNALKEFKSVVVADCYITGHVHTPIISCEDIVLPHRNKVLTVKQYFVSVPPFVRYTDYAERKALPFSSDNLLRIKLNGASKVIQIIFT